MNKILAISIFIFTGSAFAQPIDFNSSQVNLSYIKSAYNEGVAFLQATGTTIDPVVQAQVTGIGDMSLISVAYASAIYRQNEEIIKQNAEILKILKTTRK